MLWDRKTGEPVANAIVWQDRRTAQRCDALRAQGHLATIQKKTGLVLDAYFSGTKLQWLLDHVPGARARADKGELAFGTIDSWLVWNLTGGRRHVTDASNASRTLLFNIHTLRWDPQLLALFDIPAVGAARGRALQRRAGADRRRSCSAAPSPLPAWPATSRRPPSARPVFRRAWPRTPTAPAASC